MVDRESAPDFYAVLQVQPSADYEVIEAAYRQLMKKHHPDVAGMDAALAAQHHQRSKLINQAHSVLRDPVQRQRYDAIRRHAGGSPPSPSAPQAEPGQSWRSRGARGSVWEPPEAASAWIEVDEEETDGPARGPLAMVAAAYYLLPGPYEWEHERGQDLLALCFIPPVGIAAFALGTGRLAPFLGHSLAANLAAWGILLVCMLPIWSSLPRVAMASVPSLVLMSGVGDGALRQASIPTWLAWVLLGVMSMLLSARLYLFAVLPTLGVCWVLSQLS